MKTTTRLLAMIVLIALTVSVAVGCAQTPTATVAPTTSPTPVVEPLLEYTFLDTVHATAPFGYNNPNDIVTPWVEAKFNIKVKEVVFAAGQAPMEKINMMVAADNLPDVVLIDSPDVAAAFATGAFADLTSFKALMPTMDKYISDIGWNANSVDGKIVALPGSSMEIDLQNPEVASLVDGDLYYRPTNNWALQVQQDILVQLGYKFKTIEQLQAELDANPRRITAEDLAITPAIDTFAKLEKLLYDIKALGLKVDGKDLIPLDIPEWGMYHISTLFTQHGGFMFDAKTNATSGYLFNPGMKEFYKVASKWIKDGILDKDFPIMKPEQYQEKVSSGRVAVTFYIPDAAGTRQNLKAKSATNDLYPIAWPKPEMADKSYVDPSYAGGFYVYMVNAKFKNTERLVKYFDWFQTEEAQDMTTWGPESAGLWELKDSKKVFKDSALWDAIRDGKKTEDGRNAEYYGIWDKNNSVSYFTSKAFLCAPGPYLNMKSYERSYPIKMNAYSDVYNFVSSVKLCRDGTVLAPTGLNASATSSYYWGTTKSKIIKIFDAKNDTEFDSIWTEVLDDLKKNGSYDAAVADMDKMFRATLGK